MRSKLLNGITSVIIVLALLSFYGWSVRHHGIPGKAHGLWGKFLVTLTSFPDLVTQAAEEVEKLPGTFVPTHPAFASVNRLDYDINVLVSYSNEEGNRAIEVRNLKTQAVKKSWEVKDGLKPHHRIMHPLLLSNDRIAYATNGYDGIYCMNAVGEQLWHQKEIGHLASIAEPTLGYITNYGKAHLEGFGGVEGIIKGKSELYDYIAQTPKGLALVNADDAIQLEKSAACRQTTFGKTNAQFTYAVEEHDEFAGIQFSIATTSYTVKSNLSGSFNCTNLAAAVALGRYFDIPAPAIVQALTDYVPAMNRVEWRKTASNRVLLDAYNANPTSMSLSIENFAKWHKDGWLVLGDMFELGEASPVEHQAIVELVQQKNMEERCILVGKHFGGTAWHGLQFATTGDLETFWKENGAPKDAAILLKGSRGIALEQLLPLL